jgi:hypothetical protein
VFLPESTGGTIRAGNADSGHDAAKGAETEGLLNIPTWSFLTNHGRALLCIARDPEVRVREMAASLNITERRTYGILTELSEAGYITKTKEGRRNRYKVETHLPFSEHTSRDVPIGEVLQLLSSDTSIPRNNANS